MSPSDAAIEALRTGLVLLVGALILFTLYDAGLFDSFIRMLTG